MYCGSQRVQLINSRLGLYVCYIGLIPEAGVMATGCIATLIELY